MYDVKVNFQASYCVLSGSLEAMASRPVGPVKTGEGAAKAPASKPTPKQSPKPGPKKVEPNKVNRPMCSVT